MGEVISALWKNQRCTNLKIVLLELITYLGVIKPDYIVCATKLLLANSFCIQNLFQFYLLKGCYSALHEMINVTQSVNIPTQYSRKLATCKLTVTLCYTGSHE